MRRRIVGHGRWATGVVAAVVASALVSCGGASDRKASVAASEINKHATLSSWKPQLPHDEKQRIDHCFLNGHDTAYYSLRPADPALVPLLPHLVYVAHASFGMPDGDSMVDMSMWMFDSSSIAARWVGIVSKEPGTGDITHREVRRVGSVVSDRYFAAGYPDAYNDLAFVCSTA
jgi:hypothetical protein